MDGFLLGNTKLSGKMSLRKRFSRRGSLPADTLSCVDLATVGNCKNLGSVGDVTNVAAQTAPAESSGDTKLPCM